MHHDPLISSRAMKLVNWGHDWVNLCLIVANPWWAPSKVFAFGTAAFDARVSSESRPALLLRVSFRLLQESQIYLQRFLLCLLPPLFDVRVFC
jgi:hypothetical protein